MPDVTAELRALYTGLVLQIHALQEEQVELKLSAAQTKFRASEMQLKELSCKMVDLESCIAECEGKFKNVSKSWYYKVLGKSLERKHLTDVSAKLLDMRTELLICFEQSKILARQQEQAAVLVEELKPRVDMLKVARERELSVLDGVFAHRSAAIDPVDAGLREDLVAMEARIDGLREGRNVQLRTRRYCAEAMNKLRKSYQLFKASQSPTVMTVLELKEVLESLSVAHTLQTFFKPTDLLTRQDIHEAAVILADSAVSDLNSAKSLCPDVEGFDDVSQFRSSIHDPKLVFFGTGHSLHDVCLQNLQQIGKVFRFADSWKKSITQFLAEQINVELASLMSECELKLATMLHRRRTLLDRAMNETVNDHEQHMKTNIYPVLNPDGSLCMGLCCRLKATTSSASGSCPSTSASSSSTVSPLRSVCSDVISLTRATSSFANLFNRHDSAVCALHDSECSSDSVPESTSGIHDANILQADV